MDMGSIREIYDAKKTVFSCEVFPPKKDKADRADAGKACSAFRRSLPISYQSPTEQEEAMPDMQLR